MCIRDSTRYASMCNVLSHLQLDGTVLAALLSLQSTGPIVVITAAPALPAGATLELNFEEAGSLEVEASEAGEFVFDVTSSVRGDNDLSLVCNRCGGDLGTDDFLVDADNDGVADSETPVATFTVSYTGAPPATLWRPHRVMPECDQLPHSLCSRHPLESVSDQKEQFFFLPERSRLGMCVRRGQLCDFQQSRAPVPRVQHL